MPYPITIVGYDAVANRLVVSSDITNTNFSILFINDTIYPFVFNSIEGNMSDIMINLNINDNVVFKSYINNIPGENVSNTFTYTGSISKGSPIITIKSAQSIQSDLNLEGTLLTYYNTGGYSIVKVQGKFLDNNWNVGVSSIVTNKLYTVSNGSNNYLYFSFFNYNALSQDISLNYTIRLVDENNNVISNEYNFISGTSSSIDPNYNSSISNTSSLLQSAESVLKQSNVLPVSASLATALASLPTPNNNTTLSLSSIGINVTNASPQNKKEVISAIASSIFEAKSVTSFRISRNEFALSTEITKNDIIVVKPNETMPYVIDSTISPNVNMYSTLSTSGDKIQFTYKSQSFSIENVGSSFKLITPENPSGTLYIEGESVVYGDLKFVFGSVEIIKLIRPTPISVNFNTVIDACGNVTVFGAEAIAPSGELVVAEYEIPVTCLYTKNASGQDVSGLIEFWETSASHGSINCKLAQSIQGVSGDYYKDTAKLFATEMHKVFCNAFDCSSALPFSAYKSQSQEYWKHRDFGRLALSAHAHDLFGHVAATAAITNDTQFMQSMLSLSKPDGVKADGTVIQRTQDWSGNLVVQDLSGTTWSKNSATDANLALRMVWAILSKGLNANGTVKTEQDVYNATTNGSDTLSAIVRQVLGQDASRTMDVDNNELLPELHQLLRFYPGDTIYMNVKLQKPNVSYGTNPQGRPLGPFQDGDQERNFVVRVKLREPTAPPQF